MKKQISLLTAALSIGMALSITAVPGAQAQGQEKIIVSAKANPDPFTWVWFSAKGQEIGWDNATDEQWKATLTGSDWTVTDKGIVTATKGSQLIFRSGSASNEAKTFFVLGARFESQNVTTVLDGFIVRFKSDPSKGYAQVNLTQVYPDGSVRRIYLEPNLTFAATQAPGGGGGVGGFG